MRHLLIANRGEVAIRIARAAAELEIATTTIFSTDDARCLHTKAVDNAVQLEKAGPAAYLDMERIVQIATEQGCDAVHPGYGFLSESADFAKACARSGIVFIGPEPVALELFGDKAAARRFAHAHGVATLSGTEGTTSFEEAEAFFRESEPHPGVVIKAVSGGGGRGMRVVRTKGELAPAFERCKSEAMAAFGNDALYVEHFMDRARHIEVQIVGDGEDIAHLWERECTIQRRHQKLIEIAPSPSLPNSVRDELIEASLRLARESRYKGLGTFEFLVSQTNWAFIEANPRLQVEHTVTEQITGKDLVRAQIEITAGRTLADVGLTQADIGQPSGTAIQLRVNAEVMAPDGSAAPAFGQVTVFEPPSGPGVRVDSHGYAGYELATRFDSLLAKVIVWSPAKFRAAIRKAERALAEFRLEGVETNLALLQAIIAHPEFVADDVTTRFIDEKLPELLGPQYRGASHRFFEFDPRPAGLITQEAGRDRDMPPGAVPLPAPLLGTVISLEYGIGDFVRAGETIAVLEAMKMEHAVRAARPGRIAASFVSLGQTVGEGETMFAIELLDEHQAVVEKIEAQPIDHVRPDLQELFDRTALLRDEARPQAVAKRHGLGKLTARENIAALVDDGSFSEYGGFVVAAQRSRRSLDDLIRNTPADGLVAGTASIDGAKFGPERSRAMVMAYDYTVLAGTQGHLQHKKLDRLFEVCLKWKLPLILFGEGGGGRPGDVDAPPEGIESTTFLHLARLSGKVPLIGIVSGRCFAGNAALVGCCDIIIGTRDSNLGMGGPAMIEGGGLGVYRPEDIGPITIQSQNGVIDIAVEDDREAVEVARKYLSYFQGDLADWEVADQRTLRAIVPENRVRGYDMRAIIDVIADTGSVLELRRPYGKGMITALVRIEGRPFGIYANNPQHLGGAIDGEAADKASRFINLCDGHGVPLIALCDTPGFMVGPDVEATAQVRRVSRLTILGANCEVPIFTIIVRKAYGLGVLGMTAGSSRASALAAAWPTAEFGGMNLEGAVRLGFRKELEAIRDPGERKAYFDARLGEAYEKGKVMNAASYFQIDTVVDPAETRAWVLRGLKATGFTSASQPRNLPFLNVW